MRYEGYECPLPRLSNVGIGRKAPFVPPQLADPERLQLGRDKPFRRRSWSPTRHAEYNSRRVDLS